MASQAELAARFLALHQGERPLVMPNAYDVGTAKVLASLGFDAIATTSAGFAATQGRLDYHVTRDDVLTHCEALTAAVDIPVSADYENAFAHDPADVAKNIQLAADTGLAGCSIEDATGNADDPIYEPKLAAERVAAAASAAHGGAARLVLTARCENLLHGRTDLVDTITRLQSYQEAGADVLYAPGMLSADDIRTIVTSVDRPVNVLALPGIPTVAELAELGVKRISVGSAFGMVAMAAVVDAATELRDQGTYGFWTRTGSYGSARNALS
jgi:2-methylisocitrate lyase-like PEP mutase family enzyme